MPLDLQNSLLRSLIETAPYGILVLDQHDRVECWSPLAETIFEIPISAALNRPIGELLVTDLEFRKHPNESVRLADTQIKFNSELPIQIEQVIHSIEIEGQQWTVIYVNDVTLQRQREQRLTNEALTDPLSGLSNRRGFQRTLESVLSDKITLAIIDTDNFKQINDGFGHEAGDLAIEHIAKQLRVCFPEAVCFARLGGDEFGVVLKTVSLRETEAKFERFRRQIMNETPTQYNFSITVSIGVAISTAPLTSARALLKAADQSLYHAKESGRNQIAIKAING